MAARTTRAEREAALEQFPSLSDAESVEVAKRSQDIDEPKAERHVKVFVVLKRQVEGHELSEFHANNIRAMRQYAMSQGLRPTDDGKLDGQADNVDGLSVDFTYSVGVQPAVVAVDPAVSHAPADPAEPDVPGDSGVPDTSPTE